MELLVDVQLQLSRIAHRVAHPSPVYATSSCHTSTTLAPMLISIEQLLDEIRAATRAIVLKNNSYVKLELESETETEKEEKEERDEEKQNGGDNLDDIGTIRSRENEDDDDAPQCKRQGTQLEMEKDTQLRRSIEKVVQSVTECSSVCNDTPATIRHQALAGLVETSANGILQMRKLTHDGRIPSLKLAEEFSDAMVQLPELIAKTELSAKWVSTTSANLKHIFHHARKHPGWPKCLSDSSFEATSGSIRGFREALSPDLLHKMEVLIELVSQGGPLHADQLEQPLGKLASLFLTDFKGYQAQENTTRSEEEWSRFAHIGKVLAEWIYESQKAEDAPKMRAYLGKFDRQLKGFALKNPSRVPPILLQASTILARWVSRKKAPKP